MTDIITTEQMKQWAEALRSGEYQQAKYGLKVKLDDGSDGYCCLGVFEKAIRGNDPEYLKTVDGVPNDPNKYNFHFEAESLYREVGHIDNVYADSDYFVGLNDDAEHTFEEIADKIDEIVKQYEESNQ